ncbi:MAG: PG0541 family transporter-associated protein [Candidatus Kryptoniota bacterium]
MAKNLSKGTLPEHPLKMVILSVDEGLIDYVEEAFAKLEIRGYTRIDNSKGQGSVEGEPHLGTHIWPGLNFLFIIVTNAAKASQLMDEIRTIDQREGKPGIRAFLLNVEDMT